MAVLASADRARPEYFHKIAGLRLIEAIKVSAEPEFVEKAGGTRTVGVPAPPDILAIALIANDQMIERGKIKLELAALAQRLDCFNKDQVGRARTETGEGRFRKHEELAGFKVGGRLQFNLGEMRSGISAAGRHVPELLEDDAVEIFRARGRRQDTGA